MGGQDLPEAVAMLEQGCTECLALKLQQGKPEVDDSRQLLFSFSFFLLATLIKRGVCFLSIQ